jgi:hypothetical protein
LGGVWAIVDRPKPTTRVRINRKRMTKISTAVKSISEQYAQGKLLFDRPDRF